MKTGLRDSKTPEHVVLNDALSMPGLSTMAHATMTLTGGASLMFEPAPTFKIHEAGVLTFILVMPWVFRADDAAIFSNCTWPKWAWLADVGVSWSSSENDVRIP